MNARTNELELGELGQLRKDKHQKTDAFVRMPWWWIQLAAKHTQSPTTLVLAELLYLAWKRRSATFPLPNGRLLKLGVSRDVKRRVLRKLERGGLIQVERFDRRTPVITLIGL